MSRSSFLRKRRELEVACQGRINELKERQDNARGEIWAAEEELQKMVDRAAGAREDAGTHLIDMGDNEESKRLDKEVKVLERNLRSIQRRNEQDIVAIDNKIKEEELKLAAAIAAIDEEEEQFLGEQDPVDHQGEYTDIRSNMGSSNRGSLEDINRGFYDNTEMKMALEVMSRQTEILQQSLAKGSDDKYITRQGVGKDLPPFGGEYEQWPAFIAQFEQSTKACKFTNVENLYRLQKALKGVAKETVQSLLTSPDNVVTIVTLLKNQFGRPELIIKSLITKAKQAIPPQDSKPGTVIRFFNCVNNLVATVESLNRKEYLMNPALLDELIGKLQHSQRKEWGKYTMYQKITVPSLKDFSAWLEVEASAVMCYVTPEDLIQGNTKQGKKEHLLVTAGDSKGKNSCPFCSKEGHNLWDCRGYKAANLDKKWEWVKLNKRCFGCLGIGHSLEKCRRKRVCMVGGCKKNHHSSLHRIKKIEDTEEQEKKEDSLEESEEDKKTGFCGSSFKNSEVLLKIIPVTIEGTTGKVSTYALLDEGATCSLLDSNIAEELGINGPQQSLELKWTNDVTEKHDSQLVSFKLFGSNKEDGYDLKNIYTVNNLQLPTQSYNAEQLKKCYSHLENLPVHSQREARPMLLLGQDYIHLTVARAFKESKNRKAPVASKTKLGWVVHGSATGNIKRRYAFTITVNKDEELHQLVKESFRIESIGVKVQEKALKSKADARAEQLLETTTRKMDNEDRWTTGLLWKNDKVNLPESKDMATRRLISVENKMHHDPKYRDWYTEKINYYLENGYCRLATKEEMEVKTGKEFYLPHFAASNPNKPGKLRLVFDAAAKVNSYSLNDYLITGPDLLNSLPGVLTRFRRSRIAFGADVKEMFHQIKINNGDLPAQRFLWRGGKADIEPQVYVMDSMIFGAGCSPCSAQYVMRRNAETWIKKCPDAVKSITRNMYMDDLADCCDDEEVAKNRVAAINKIQDSGGFPMLKWTSNVSAVLEGIPKERIAEDMQSFDLKEVSSVERVLGLFCNPKEDTLNFRFNFPKVKSEIMDGSTTPTKREVLRVTMSLFDPLGILTNYTIRARILLQDIWRSEIGWDDQIKPSQLSKWKEWLVEIINVRNVKIPRCFSRLSLENFEVSLHLFCDASEKAYAAVAYVILENCEKREVSFVFGKARVSPLKPLSIPRLELQSAITAVRIANFIKEEIDMKINKTTYWTDSRTVLCWIRSDARNYKQFVSHRIGEILETTDVADWKWVPTKENPADDATRDESAMQLTSDSRWIQGPEFLRQSEDKWPKEKQQEPDNVEEMEMRAQRVHVTINSSKYKIKWDNHSTLNKTVRAWGWIHRYIHNLKRKCTGEETTATAYLSPKELKLSQDYLFKMSQMESYKKEYGVLKKGGVMEKDSSLYKLSPFMDKNGIIRMKSRLENVKLACVKSPVILCGTHKLTQLLLMQCHMDLLHGNHEAVIGKVREEFWIPNIRSNLKKVIKSCFQCRIKSAAPTPPVMGNLPDSRCTINTPPFSQCGVDVFGPVTVLDGRKSRKCYVALFTCLTTRGIHLERLDSLSADSLILALRRFMAIRTKPDVLWSDNGTNMKGAKKEIKEAMKSLLEENVEEKLSMYGIEFKNIPPFSPNFGGAWERLIRCVKNGLYAALDSMKIRTPRMEVFDTLLMEVMDIVNNRPMTHVSMDHEAEEALTPNHFLKGFSKVLCPFGAFTDNDYCLRKQWKMSQRLVDHFWYRWLKEYVPLLHARKKWNKDCQPVKEGDFVFIADSNILRGHWTKAVVVATFPGKDGVIRVVDLRTGTGKILRRPINKCAIVNLEC